MEEKFDYTSAMEELEQLVAKVGDPSVSLSDVEASVKRASELIKACREYLRGVREGLEEIVKA